jgi:hypothetical protein
VVGDRLEVDLVEQLAQRPVEVDGFDLPSVRCDGFVLSRCGALLREIPW